MNKKQAICKVSKTPAKKGKGITHDYEKSCWAKDFEQAEKEGNLIMPRKGENVFQAVKRHLAEKAAAKAAERKALAEKNKTASVSMRIPVYIVNLAKAQAKKAGVPYTSFMVGIIENAMVKPNSKAAAAR
jgi:predicted DNA binding CopG/RHH family protein